MFDVLLVCTTKSITFFLTPSLSLLPLPPSPSSLPQQWSVYARNMIRACTGLRVLADLLNNGHDAVIRAGATALRNLAMDPRNKANLGKKIAMMQKYLCEYLF